MTLKERLEKVCRWAHYYSKQREISAMVAGNDFVGVEDYESLKRAFDKVVQQRDTYRSDSWADQSGCNKPVPSKIVEDDDAEVLAAYEGEK